MKILLIGHSIVDHFDESGFQISYPGGIFYSTLGILSLSKPGDEIFLLTGMNQNSFYLFEKLYSKVNLNYANTIKEMPEVILKTSGEGEREEIYKNLSSQLSFNHVEDWDQYSGILINMITGFDISIDQLKTIRKKFCGTIYFDLHTLSRGVGINMEREFRPIPQVEEWLDNIDILQCNENELKTIIQGKTENDSALEILEHGIKLVIITKGERGAHIYFKSDDKMKTNFIEAVKIRAVNKIGCGDIFGAVFFYSYISTGDVSKSLVMANKAGAAAASTKEIASQTVLKIV